MKKFIFILPVLLVLFSACAKESDTQDWAKIAEDHKILCNELEDKGYPDSYIVKEGKNYLVFDGTPELGVGMHQITQEGLDVLKKLNIRFVRHTLYWGLMEDKDGKKNEDYLKEFHNSMDLMEKEGFIPLIVVHQAPNGFSFGNREDAYSHFAEFMSWAAKEFPYVRYWQLWNEMDVAFTDLFGANVKKEDGSEYSMTERAAFYVDMLKIAYPVIKKANSKAVVVSGSAATSSEFQEGIYKAGGKDYFDIMSMHTYGTPLSWAFVGRGKGVRDVMDKYGDNNKPLWNTEFGSEAGALYSAWGVPENPLETWLIQQKDQIKDCIEFNEKAGLFNKYFIYQYIAGLEGNKEAILEKVSVPEGDNIDNYGFGIVKMDNSLKPVSEWIMDNNPNKNIKKNRRISVKIGKNKKQVSVNSAYPVVVK